MTEPKKVTDHAFVPPEPVKPQPNIWTVFRRHGLFTWACLFFVGLYVILLVRAIAQGNGIGGGINLALAVLYAVWFRYRWRDEVAKRR